MAHGLTPEATECRPLRGLKTESRLMLTAAIQCYIHIQLPSEL